MAKDKGGRPRKPRSKRRAVVVGVRYSDAEAERLTKEVQRRHAAIKAKCGEAKYTLTDYIRECTLGPLNHKAA